MTVKLGKKTESRINIPLTESLKKEVDRAAVIIGISQSEFVRWAIGLGLKEWKRKEMAKLIKNSCHEMEGLDKKVSSEWADTVADGL